MKHRQSKRISYGFTMIELMAVLIIMGLLFAIVAGNFVNATDEARIKTTRANLKLLHNAVKQFKMDTGRYPTEEEGLDVLIHPPMDVQNYEPYLDQTELPVDGWGQEFVYELYPESGLPFVITSYGPDKELGGGDDLLSTDSGRSDTDK